MNDSETTPWAIKTRHFTFVNILADYWPIFKILSLSHTRCKIKEKSTQSSVCMSPRSRVAHATWNNPTTQSDSKSVRKKYLHKTSQHESCHVAIKSAELDNLQSFGRTAIIPQELHRNTALADREFCNGVEGWGGSGEVAVSPNKKILCRKKEFLCTITARL